jgi:hypothetical protein
MGYTPTSPSTQAPPSLPRRQVLALAAGALAVPAAPAPATAAAGGFTPSFIAGARDPAGRFAGGTELRLLTTHGGRLYAGNGYWEDRPGSEGWQGAQVLVLDAPNGAWRVDHAFQEPMRNGRWRDLAVGALAEAVFATDGAGHALPRPVALLLASTWDLTGATRVFTRDDATGAWDAVTLTYDRPSRDFLPQIRSFATHRDRVTGVDLVFSGGMPHGIRAGCYDPAAPGRIRWAENAELEASAVNSGFSGLGGRLRVSSFAEANGQLHAAVGQQVFARVDGPAPRWQAVYTNPRPGHSETGLRGLTALRGADGRDSLLAGVEGSAGRIVRIDPATGAEVTELDLTAFLGRAWGMRIGYTISAYNDMTVLPVPGHGDVVLMGLFAFIARDAAIAPGHDVVDVGYGRVDSDGWYLVRWPDGRYDLRRVNADFPRALVATRTIRASPFSGDGDAVYFGGYDAAKSPTHDTAWIARATLAAAVGGGR